MDSDHEDVLDLLVSQNDIEDMELDDPILESPFRGDRDGNEHAPPREDQVIVLLSEPPLAGESASDIPLAGSQSEKATKPKTKKKKNNRRSPAALERKRLKHKANKKAWAQKLRQE